eukprot:42958-Amorphochlora_amoeboformis.AAC.4
MACAWHPDGKHVISGSLVEKKVVCKRKYFFLCGYFGNLMMLYNVDCHLELEWLESARVGSPARRTRPMCFDNEGPGCRPRHGYAIKNLMLVISPNN